MSTDSATKPLVLVVGATGRTGVSIVNALLNSGTYRIVAVGRDGSKPSAQKLREKGIEFRVADIDNDDVAKLTEILKGVNILIIATLNETITQSTRLFDAAKAAGVGRVVPNEWGPFAPEGVMLIQDRKYQVREYIRKIDLNHTFIEVGWWLQLYVPLPPYPPKVGPFEGWEGWNLEPILNTLWGTGNVPTGVVDLHRIGELVVRIIGDERTLNRVVYAAEAETTSNDIWETAARVSGDRTALLQQQIKIPPEEAEALLSQVRADWKADSEKTAATLWPIVKTEYSYSLFVRGDNTFANATKNGSLIALELYPDYKPTRVEEYVEAFYAR